MLVVADCFINCTEAYSISNQETTTVTKWFIMLLLPIMCCIDPPEMLRDQEVQFQSEFVGKCMRQTLKRTSSYHTQMALWEGSIKYCTVC